MTTIDSPETPPTDSVPAGGLPIQITPKAIEMAKKRLVAAAAESEKPVLGLRLGVKGGGCSGFFYVFDLATKIREKRDQVYEFDGLKVVIDDRSLEYLQGSTLDWQQKLMHYGFEWKNPRAKSLCGCGESFTIG